jgi:hypothetical protein
VCKAMPNPFSLSVVPGPTSPAVTTALGSHLTLSTAGVASEFVITAKDAFSNRRPGGDTISVLMGLWACTSVDLDKPGASQMCVSKGALIDPTADPKTGTVLDNSDGSYSTSYIITAAGNYRLDIDFSGTLGASSPFLLRVMTEVADKSLTYAYGRLAGIAAGRTSEIYVQTRDRYGNHIRADNEAYPPGQVQGGTEDVQFELCLSVGQDISKSCAGGEVYSSVGVTVSYSVGPDGNTINADTNEPFYGLYQIIFFPFEPEPVIPRVLHGDKMAEGETAEPPTPVPCFFDTSGIPSVYSLMDPGPELANQCANKAANTQAAARRLGRGHGDPMPRVTITAPDESAEQADADRQGFKGNEATASPVPQPRESIALAAAGSHSSRRAPKNVGQDELKVAIQKTFVSPDTQIIEFWLVFAPIICAAIGALFALMNLTYSFLEQRRLQKLRRAPSEAAEATSREVVAGQEQEQQELPGKAVINDLLVRLLLAPSSSKIFVRVSLWICVRALRFSTRSDDTVRARILGVCLPTCAPLPYRPVHPYLTDLCTPTLPYLTLGKGAY